MPLRLMQYSDLFEILPLDHQIFPEEDPYSFDALFHHFNKQYCFVSYDDHSNRINGFIFASLLTPHSVTISNIGVVKNWQSMGIGSQLMKAVIDKVQHNLRDIETLRLRVRVDNYPALRLYGKYSFEASDQSAESGWQYMTRRASNIPPNTHIIEPRVEQTESTFLLSTIQRQDILAVDNEIKRLERNAQSIFSMYNTAKANHIKAALTKAINSNVIDVRQDGQVREALAEHRIFSFFGVKKSQSLINVDNSFSKNC